MAAIDSEIEGSEALFKKDPPRDFNVHESAKQFLTMNREIREKIGKLIENIEAVFTREEKVPLEVDDD